MERETDGQYSSTLTIGSLPDEVLRLVFAFFPPQQLCSLLAFVCSHWHHLSRDPLLWQRLTLHQTTLSAAIKLFKTAPLRQLKFLKVRVWDDSGDVLLALIAAHCPALMCLEHPDTAATSFGATSLQALAENCPRIEQLTFIRITIADRHYTALSLFSNLKVLRVTVNLQQLCDGNAFDDCAQLTHLCVLISPQSNTKMICAFIKKYATKLRWFGLVDGQRIDDDACHALSRCSNLTKLATNITSQSALASIAAGLKQLVNLKIIDCSSVSSAALVSVFAGADILPRLKELRLSNCGAAITKCLPQLKVLWIRECQIGADTIAELKSASPSLSIEI